ncbi:hypothetical protein NLJ89_g2374 [Agrocybe chaxingu]|uniref:Uncharacterized protein n=1 Tax=Agrocybe chaxingu TaxID=84603 RepID=A0A9W8MYW4_9AGAR|nr:hypothetical protein NLJ89_g2374 [Agrocybe chaxingu]
MLKTILYPMGGILLMNDAGNAILSELDVPHIAAKNMIELSRMQDEECGDRTTSVISAAKSSRNRFPNSNATFTPWSSSHPTKKALKEALEFIKRISISININDYAQMFSLIKTIGTKFIIRWSELVYNLVHQAIRTVAQDVNGLKIVDIKRYARVEILGAKIEQRKVLRGDMLNKNLTSPNMRRRIEKLRIVLLDSPLEY